MNKLTEEQKKIVEENMNLVYFTIYKYFKNSLFLVEMEELIQEGMYALCKCIPYYNEEKGKISTFIVKCVKKHLSYYIIKKCDERIPTTDIEKVENILSYEDKYNFSYENELKEFLKKYLPEPSASMAVDRYIYEMEWEQIAQKYGYVNRKAACSIVKCKMKRISENKYLRNKYIELFI